MSNKQNDEIFEEYQELKEEVEDAERAYSQAEEEVQDAIAWKVKKGNYLVNDTKRLQDFEAKYIELLDTEIKNEANRLTQQND